MANQYQKNRQIYTISSLKTTINWLSSGRLAFNSRIQPNWSRHHLRTRDHYSNWCHTQYLQQSKPNVVWPFLKLNGHKKECCILVCKAYQRSVKHKLSKGVWGHSPRKYLQNKHSEIESETTLNCLSLNLIHIHFTAIFL